jgi:hypothetical protein
MSLFYEGKVAVNQLQVVTACSAQGELTPCARRVMDLDISIDIPIFVHFIVSASRRHVLTDPCYRLLHFYRTLG